MKFLLSAVALVAGGASASTSEAANVEQAMSGLRSPWGEVSGSSALHSTYNCPTLRPPPRVISFAGYYSDPRHSLVDQAAKEAYRAASEPTESYTRRLVNAADAFRTKGNTQAAACAIRLLIAEADAGSLTNPHLSAGGSRQGFYVQTWITAGSALAYLKVENSASPADQAKIASWLNMLGHGVVDFQERLAAIHSEDSRNNIHAWAALAVTAAGVCSQSPELFGWGILAAREELGQVDYDGYLPLELKRGRLALHYHIFAIAPLVALAEVARANGIDLYRPSHAALRRLTQRVLLGIEDHSVFDKRTGEAQERPDFDSGLTAAWVVPLEQRFPHIHVDSRLRRAAEKSYFMLGGYLPH